MTGKEEVTQLPSQPVTQLGEEKKIENGELRIEN
jgi:hypothetical protein